MRLAECFYRTNKFEKGMKYLIKLENEIRPTKIYTISLLKGKYNDSQKQF